MNIKREPYGKTPEGVGVDLYTLTNDHGLRVKIMTYGATITSVETPDRAGKVENVTLSLDSLEDYLKGHPFFGSTVGRFANRIAKGKFSLDGVEYTLAKNDGPNHLHGGIRGFDKYVWHAEPIQGDAFVGIKFSHESPDGDEGYPGRLSVEVTYGLSNADELKMDYAATTDKPTVVNLTNHAYWNLNGGADDVLQHEMTLHADRYLPVDGALTPLGDVKSVAGTPMDFTRPMTIGSRIEKAGGYDHCYVLNQKKPGDLTLVAKVVEPTSGRTMTVYTTEPSVQFYTGNFLGGDLKVAGKPCRKHLGFCLETQHYPDSPNRVNFPSTVLRPGATYRHTTVHTFGVNDAPR